MSRLSGKIVKATIPSGTETTAQNIDYFDVIVPGAAEGDCLFLVSIVCDDPEDYSGFLSFGWVNPVAPIQPWDAVGNAAPWQGVATFYNPATLSATSIGDIHLYFKHVPRDAI